MDHFAKSTGKTTSTFHEEKIGNAPSVTQAAEIAQFNSAKSAIDKDLSHLLSSKLASDENLVFSVHFADVNGLSRLESNILAHEISSYLGKCNQTLAFQHD